MGEKTCHLVLLLMVTQGNIENRQIWILINIYNLWGIDSCRQFFSLTSSSKVIWKQKNFIQKLSLKTRFFMKMYFFCTRVFRNLFQNLLDVKLGHCRRWGGRILAFMKIFWLQGRIKPFNMPYWWFMWPYFGLWATYQQLKETCCKYGKLS